MTATSHFKHTVKILKYPYSGEPCLVINGEGIYDMYIYVRFSEVNELIAMLQDKKMEHEEQMRNGD